ncbi:GM16946 [Drosophila sechellia]|uniref:GM16946 n=1 Tax=Drosophila sechellia TaxID=7238 RepID=B4IP40_DROSE|nr:GM16946 [Drosophila sechellia]
MPFWIGYTDEDADLLNAEVRADALHAFTSGLKKSLRAVVFPAQPKDLPSALALAREAKASIERSMFASSYAKAVEERAQTCGNGKSRFQGRQGKDNREEQRQNRNPHFVRPPKGNTSAQNINDNQARTSDYGGRRVFQVQAANRTQ